MFTNNQYIKLLLRITLIGIYLPFFLVQFNVHMGETPAVSYFTGDFVSQQTGKTNTAVLSKEHAKDSHTRGFRLNKRFHPSYLFTAPDPLQDLVKYSFSIKSTLLNETQPLCSFSFNAPSLRGPPAQIV